MLPGARTLLAIASVLALLVNWTALALLAWKRSSGSAGTSPRRPPRSGPRQGSEVPTSGQPSSAGPPRWAGGASRVAEELARQLVEHGITAHHWVGFGTLPDPPHRHYLRGSSWSKLAWSASAALSRACSLPDQFTPEIAYPPTCGRVVRSTTRLSLPRQWARQDRRGCRKSLELAGVECILQVLQEQATKQSAKARAPAGRSPGG